MFEARGKDAAETSLAKAIRLLPIVADRNKTGVNLSTVARKANLTIPTARRLLQGLVDGGLLSFDPYTKIYTLGIRLFDLAEAAGSPRDFDVLRLGLRPALEETSLLTGEASYATVPYGDEALCIATASGKSPVSPSTLQAGSRRPLGVGAGSAAILAALPADHCEHVITSYAETYGHYGDLTVAEVRRMVRHYRNHGYLVNNSVIIPDVSAIAVAVFDQSGTLLAGLSVSVLRARLTPDREREIVDVMTAALKRAGYRA